MVNKEKIKVLIIGLDGATFDLLQPWAKEGKLPTLARLMKKGASGTLTSVTPPISPCAWASFITGKNPGKHGILGFWGQKEGSYDRAIMDPSCIDATTIWSILSESGKNVGVAYVPFTPVKKVNGFIIPGVFTPQSIPAYPPDLETELVDRIPNYEITRGWQKYVIGLDDLYLKRITDATDKIEETTLYLMKKYPWDFFMTVFFYGDSLQHFFWKHMDSQHPAYNSKEAKKYGNTILHYYQKIDRILGRLLKKIDTHTTVIIMSDHGAGPVHKIVYINHWLMKKNLLKLRNVSKMRNLERFISKQLTRADILDKVVKSGLLEMVAKIKPIKFLRNEGSKLVVGSRPALSDIDWTQTKAYSVGIFGQIFINLVGREPHGIVKPGKEYEELRNFLIEELYKLKDPEDNGKLVDKVFKREDAYWGPHTSRAADLFFTMKDMKYYTNIFFEFGTSPDILTEPPLYVSMESGTHRMNGIFIVAGPNINGGIAIDSAKILDVAPTVLHIMDVPIPSDMDGRVLREIFEPGSDLAKKEVKYRKPSKKKVKRKKKSREEKKQIEERLKALGYLG